MQHPQSENVKCSKTLISVLQLRQQLDKRVFARCVYASLFNFPSSLFSYLATGSSGAFRGKEALAYLRELTSSTYDQLTEGGTNV